MESFGAVLLGLMTASMCVVVAQFLGAQIETGWRMTVMSRIALLVIGGITGFVIRSTTVREALALASFTTLFLLQSPIDISFRRLARQPTIVAALLIEMLHLINVPEYGWREGWLKSNIAVLGVVLVFAFIHRISRDVLGWGDVLIVVPAGLSVGYFDVAMLPWWLLVASLTASLHGIIANIRGQRHVPFGPHLLVAAWLMLVVSV